MQVDLSVPRTNRACCRDWVWFYQMILIEQIKWNMGYVRMLVKRKYAYWWYHNVAQCRSCKAKWNDIVILRPCQRQMARNKFSLSAIKICERSSGKKKNKMVPAMSKGTPAKNSRTRHSIYPETLDNLQSGMPDHTLVFMRKNGDTYENKPRLWDLPFSCSRCWQGVASIMGHF